MSYNEKLEDLIDHYFIANEDLNKNKNLGWVGWLVNGNMCFGIYEDYLILRVDVQLAEALLKKTGVGRFNQADDTAGQMLSIESKIYENREVLHRFLDRGLQYTSSLPPKKG